MKPKHPMDRRERERQARLAELRDSPKRLEQEFGAQPEGLFSLLALDVPSERALKDFDQALEAVLDQGDHRSEQMDPARVPSSSDAAARAAAGPIATEHVGTGPVGTGPVGTGPVATGPVGPKNPADLARKNESFPNQQAGWPTNDVEKNGRRHNTGEGDPSTPRWGRQVAAWATAAAIVGLAAVGVWTQLGTGDAGNAFQATVAEEGAETSAEIGAEKPSSVAGANPSGVGTERAPAVDFQVIPASKRSIELIEESHDAQLLDLSVGDMQIVMIFDEDLDL